MITRLKTEMGSMGRPRLVAAGLLGLLLSNPHAARADLVQCVVFVCSKPGPIPNPLAETAGSASARTTDGEAVVENQQSVQWNLLRFTNLTPIHPLEVDTVFELPGSDFETATSSAILNTSNTGHPFAAVTASSGNSNPFGLTLGGAAASATLQYQVAVLQRSTASAAPAVGSPVTIDIAGTILGTGLTGAASSGSWSSGSASVSITDANANSLYSNSQQDSFGSVSYSSSFSFTVGSFYNVELDATVATHGDISTAHVFVDPLFTIDPSTPNADQLYVLYSDGIAQDFDLGPSGTPMPEPPALLVFCIGLVGTGIVRSRPALRPAQPTP